MFAIEAVTALISAVVDCKSARRRGGRVAEGGGLLNRYTVKSCIGGSNPPLSASRSKFSQHRYLLSWCLKLLTLTAAS
jgi:hypothetical protein